MRKLLITLASALTMAGGATAFAQNPLDFGGDIRTADPSGHVWQDGKMYLYVSHDEECQPDFFMKDWHVFSSEDLVNWEGHGPVLSVDDLSWADNYAWAPDAAYKNGKYYFVFPAGTGDKDRVNPENSTKWMGIGIAVSDSPTGPFKDAIGAPLWREPYANDPSMFIDDDGKAYLYFHGTDFDYHVVEMADDMLSTKGDFIKMDMGGYEPKMEGPWVFKRHDTYYFTMPENNRELAYYTSSSPTGPWTYRGIFMEQEHQANNHHSIVEYKGQWILFYHRWVETPESGCTLRERQRHVTAEYIHFNEDGTIVPVTRTEKGVSDFPDRIAREAHKPIEPVKLILVGDSTTQASSGWGGAFCSKHVSHFIACLNLARGGRSSFSYRKEGSWDLALSEMGTAGYEDTYVLIQLGHNDQPGKPGRSTDLETEFTPNLRQFVEETRQAGATPVLVTPLTRWSFEDGDLTDSLDPWAQAVRTIAEDMDVPLVDLYALSRAKITEMGAEKAMWLGRSAPPQEVLDAARRGTTYPSSEVPRQERGNEDGIFAELAYRKPYFDYSHLGDDGARIMSNIVAIGLAEEIPALRPHLYAYPEDNAQ